MSKFGWCLTGHHKDCRIAFFDWVNKETICECDCHEGQELPTREGGRETPNKGTAGVGPPDAGRGKSKRASSKSSTTNRKRTSGK